MISANPEENVMNVYYVKSSFLYRVEYYYDDILALDATEVYTALYGSFKIEETCGKYCITVPAGELFFGKF